MYSDELYIKIQFVNVNEILQNDFKALNTMCAKYEVLSFSGLRDMSVSVSVNANDL